MPWLPWSSSSEPSATPSKHVQPTAATKLNTASSRARSETDALLASLDARASELPPHLLLTAVFVVGGTSALGARYVYARYWRRIPNGDWVNPDMLKRKRWIKGYVTSVGDADNFRLYHTPGIGWRWPLKFRRIPAGRKLKNQTIHIRLAGVDAPELGHFGRPAMPYAEDSMAWLKSQVERRFIYCQLVQRDQYGRIVAVPHLKPRLLPGWLATGKSLSLEMLRAGWGSVYEQAGAVYGSDGLEVYRRIQKEAQDAKRGIWKKGLTGETPAEYKRRYRDSPEPVEELPTSQSTSEETKGWFSRLFRLGS